jgi:4'-phosphopantetheinyl transferase
VPALASRDIHVWRFALWAPEPVRSLLHSHLSAEERSRAARFHFERDRDRFVVAHGVLRVLLARYAGLEPGALNFGRGAHGKPGLVDQPGGDALTFNLSHAETVAVCAVGRNRRLGIDVEEPREDFFYEDIAPRYFSTQEVRALANLPPAQRANGFIACWVCKEAYVKALGTGLHTPLDSFTVSLVPGGPARFLAGVAPAWQVSCFTAGWRCQAALVYEGAPVDVRFFRLRSESISAA